MWRSPEPLFDVAAAICQGGRTSQEDTIITDFPLGADSGIAVLADGMGGHAAGDIASAIVATEVFSALKFHRAGFSDAAIQIPQLLTMAAVHANDALRNHIAHHPETRGMGATLVAVVLVENRMFWMSVGDSPLYLYRDGALRQLNEDHSLAAQIDAMVQSGQLAPEAGRNHPDRHCLTAVIQGDRVAKSDCPKTAFALCQQDIVIVASDGLQALPDRQISALLRSHDDQPAAKIAARLLAAISDLGDPDQDNCAFCVIKLIQTPPAATRNGGQS